MKTVEDATRTGTSVEGTSNATTSSLAEYSKAPKDDCHQEDKMMESSSYDWLSIIPTMLEHRHLKCTEQSIESARMLQEDGLLGNFTKHSPTSNDEQFLLSSQVEASLLESFLEDDYDGALHLTTLDDGTNKPVGFVFWRQVPTEEMKDWIQWDKLKQRLLKEQQLSLSHKQQEEEEGGSSMQLVEKQEQQKKNRRQMRESLKLVRNESIRWLEMASTNNDDDGTRTTSQEQLSLPPSSNATDLSTSAIKAQEQTIMEELTHSWVKIELLAVHPEYWNQRLGTLLLACAMYQAHCTILQNDNHNGQPHSPERMILHVAGGMENVPALRLYEKFGFMPVPQGTVFHKPDKDLMVLGNVHQSLQLLCWPAVLALQQENENRQS